MVARLKMRLALSVVALFRKGQLEKNYLALSKCQHCVSIESLPESNEVHVGVPVSQVGMIQTQEIQ